MYGIIMAGGIGKRFWPMSRAKRPKQFLKLFGDRSMIQMTYDRLQPAIKPENIYVITNKVQQELTSAELPGLPERNIIAEPLGKDTAPCIGLGALLAMERDPDAVMVVLPADHLIKDEDKFRETLKLGAGLATTNSCLITIGIEPTRPETGYGYIQIMKKSGKDNLPAEFQGKGIYKVKTFAEKPNLSTAKRFIDSGDFLWNSGIFIWKAQTILNRIEELLPELYESLMEVRQHLNKPGFNKALLKAYQEIKSISVDYGVMEKAHDVYLIKADFGWSDVGSWEEFYNLSDKDDKGNVREGSCLMLDSHNNLIISDKVLVAGIGLEDMVVVHTGDAVLICPRDKSQNVKELYDNLMRKQVNSSL